MTASDPRQQLSNAYRQAAIIAGSMMGTVVVYLIVVELLKRAGGEPLTSSPVVRLVMFVVGLSVIFVVPLVKSQILRVNKPNNMGALVGRLNSANVVTMALAEGPAIMGLALYFLTRNYMDFVILALISLYLLVRHFPRLSTWESIAREFLGPEWKTAGS